MEPPCLAPTTTTPFVSSTYLMLLVQLYCTSTFCECLFSKIPFSSLSPFASNFCLTSWPSCFPHSPSFTLFPCSYSLFHSVNSSAGFFSINSVVDLAMRHNFFFLLRVTSFRAHSDLRWLLTMKEVSIVNLSAVLWMSIILMPIRISILMSMRILPQVQYQLQNGGKITFIHSYANLQRFSFLIKGICVLIFWIFLTNFHEEIKKYMCLELIHIRIGLPWMPISIGSGKMMRIPPDPDPDHLHWL